MLRSLLKISCLLCHAAADDAVCSGCLNDLAYLKTDAAAVCPLCARSSVGAAVCGRCQQKMPPFQAFWASVRYAGPIPSLLHEFKHLQQPEYGRVFQALMAANPPPWLHECDIDDVLAMPVSRLRRIERGFNQSDELARWVTQYYNLPLLPSDCVQRRHKPPQSTLTAAERQQNVKNVFQADEIVKNRKILIIDDVRTTGATIGELARTLNQSGVTAVFVWVVACN